MGFLCPILRKSPVSGLDCGSTWRGMRSLSTPKGKRAAVAAPVAPVVPSPPVSAAAQPEKPAAGAAAVVPPSAEVAEVWERGDKYARGTVPKPMAVAADVVMVKGHERALPGTVEKAKEPLTLDVLVKEFERDQEQTTAPPCGWAGLAIRGFGSKANGRKSQSLTGPPQSKSFVAAWLKPRSTRGLTVISAAFGLPNFSAGRRGACRFPQSGKCNRSSRAIAIRRNGGW